LSGNNEEVTLDRWALRAVQLDADKKLPKDTREEVVRSYREAAEFVGESVRDFQAIVWLSVKGNN